MFCPKCNSSKVNLERSSGYLGYRCDGCGEWSYEREMGHNVNLTDILVWELYHYSKVCTQDIADVLNLHNESIKVIVDRLKRDNQVYLDNYHSSRNVRMSAYNPKSLWPINIKNKGTEKC